jgi:hypothetical protein
VIFAPVLSSVFQPVAGSAFAPSQGGTDADAAAWAAAVTAAGGTYSPTTLAAVSAFAVSAKASGYWTKINRINLFCGNQLAAALVPLKVGGGSATETNVNFVAGDYTEATGLTGNGSTKYLNTGLVPSASLTLNDTHLSVYNRGSLVAGGGAHIGATSSATVSTFYILAPLTDGSVYSDQYTNSAASGRVFSAALPAPFGFVVGSRTGSTAHAVYQNGTSLATSASVSTGTLPTVPVYVCAQDSSGAPGNWVSNPLAAYSIGSGLSAADVTAYNTHMQTFQQALLRNV